jgi:hypothetical protein
LRLTNSSTSRRRSGSGSTSDDGNGQKRNPEWLVPSTARVSQLFRVGRHAEELRKEDKALQSLVTHFTRFFPVVLGHTPPTSSTERESGYQVDCRFQLDQIECLDSRESRAHQNTPRHPARMSALGRKRLGKAQAKTIILAIIRRQILQRFQWCRRISKPLVSATHPRLRKRLRRSGLYRAPLEAST